MPPREGHLLSCAAFKMVFWKDPQFAAWDHEHRPIFNEGSALAPGQLVSFTSSLILKRNLCPYYLTSSSVAVNYIKAHFPKLRNFRIYFVACCDEESLLGIRAPSCRGHRAGQTPAISVTPHHHRSCETETPLPTEVALIPQHLPKERAEPPSAAQDTGSPPASPREERGDVTGSPQVKTWGHKGEVLPTSSQLTNALIKKNGCGLLSGPKGTTHTHASLCPQDEVALSIPPVEAISGPCHLPSHALASLGTVLVARATMLPGPVPSIRQRRGWQASVQSRALARRWANGSFMQLLPPGTTSEDTAL